MIIAENPIFHVGTKHIEIHYHFGHNQVISTQIEVAIFLP
jgi:hypothetical protein